MQIFTCYAGLLIKKQSLGPTICTLVSSTGDYDAHYSLVNTLQESVAYFKFIKYFHIQNHQKRVKDKYRLYDY